MSDDGTIGSNLLNLLAAFEDRVLLVPPGAERFSIDAALRETPPTALWWNGWSTMSRPVRRLRDGAARELDDEAAKSPVKLLLRDNPPPRGMMGGCCPSVPYPAILN